MGRPLAKRYFGNTNTPAIGGEGVLSAAINAAGSYTTRPVFTFSAPQLPGGVTATGTITSEINSVSVGGTQTRAYPVAAGAISFVGGTTTSTYTATVTSSALASVGNSANTQISFNTTTTAMISGTSIHITGTVTGNLTIGGTTIAGGQIYYVGAPTTATAATLYANYADAVAATNPLAIGGSTVTGATFTRGVTYGTVTALTPVNRGEFEALVTGAQAAVCATYGAGLTITPAYRAKSVVITTAGSGYTSTATVATGPTQSVTLQTITMTTTKSNAITVTADTGNGDATVDVVKQVSSRRYKVTDGTTTLVCKLAASGSLAVGEASIIARDSGNGGTPSQYYVTKLTAHRALLTRKTDGGSGYEFATGAGVPWNLTAAVLNTSVKLDNA
jgi:hypothetical protein